MKKLLLAISILFLLACSDTQEDFEAVLSEEQMVLVMKDFMLLEATYNTRLIRLSDKDERMEQYNVEVLKKHSISKEDFDATYVYYINNPIEFEAMMQLVFEELNKMETEAAKYNKVTPGDSTNTKKSR